MMTHEIDTLRGKWFVVLIVAVTGAVYGLVVYAQTTTTTQLEPADAADRVAALAGIPKIQARAFVLADASTATLAQQNTFKTRFAAAYAERPNDLRGIVARLSPAERRLVLNAARDVLQARRTRMLKDVDAATTEALSVLEE